MKKQLKRCMAGILAALLIVMTFGMYLPKGNHEAKAAGNAAEAGKYMAKIQPEAWEWITQSVGVTAGKTYRFTCNYYVAEGSGGTAVLWTNASGNEASGFMKPNTRGTVDFSLTVAAEQTGMAFRFDINPDATVYVWNVLLREEGSETNLLTNADFSAENGSWIGWSFRNYIADKTASDALKDSYKTEILPLDTSSFPAVDPIPSGEPNYMAKVDNSDECGWLWIYQYLGVEAGKTYRFTCNYYVEQGAGADVYIGTNKEDTKRECYADTRGTIDMTLKASGDATELFTRFEIKNNSVVYLWNVCLREEYGEGNLLKNANFEKENGSWMNWTIAGTYVSDKTISDGMKATHGTEIMAFSTSSFPAVEGIPTGEPEYVAKIQLPATANWLWIYQSVGAEAGKTYRFTCNYYVEAGDGGSAGLWTNLSNNASYEASKTLSTGAQGSLDMSLKAQLGTTGLSARFEIAPGSTIYVWNVCLREENGDVNLLKNASFAKENGSWIGWNVGGYIADKNASDATKATYGTEILAYSSSLFPQPEGIPTGDPKYMAEIQLSSEANWLWIYQSLGAEAGKTYQFSCQYYVKDGDGGNAVLWTNLPENELSASQALKTNTQGTIDFELNTIDGVNGISARFEVAPGSTIYVWNVCLREKDGNINLLNNGSFSKENGTWIGWSVGQSGTIKDKTTSDAMKETYGTSIIPYSKDIFPQPEIPENIPTGDPKYVAKIQLPSDANWLWIYQGIEPVAGKKYHFTANYYVAEGEGGAAVIWASSNGKNTKEELAKLKSDTQGTIDLMYQVSLGEDRLNARFEIAPGSTIYIWNVCLNEEGGKINLLSNGSFSKENGTWIGWQVGQEGLIKDKSASNALKEKYGTEVILFDSTIFPGEPVPDKVPSGDPKYMAKLVGSFKGKDGKMHTYVNVRQGITPEVGKTYIFSCEYYARATDAGASILLWSDTSKGSEGDAYGRFRARTQAGTEGKLEITYTATEGDTFIAVSMECEPDSECYMWNFCLREKGSDVNLLKNGGFTQGDGTWIGWAVGEMNVATKAESDTLTDTYGYKVVKFKRSDIERMKEEDASFKTYQDPNVAFSFDDVNKYKELDASLVKLSTNDTKKEETVSGSKQVITQKVIFLLATAALVVGLGAGGVGFYFRKKKRLNIKK